jgi:DNA-binding transcriptional regulator YiaG
VSAPGVRFRNVDVDPDAPVDRWPAEAIETVLDRGALSDWRRLAAAVRANPWGPAARAIESAAGAGDHYGVDPLLLGVIHAERRRVTAEIRGAYARRLRAARAATGLSLRDFAAHVGTSASRLSDYENGKTAPTTDVLGRIERVSERLVAQARAEGS